MKKIALITGATGGIGSAFADLFLEHEYRLILPVRSMQKLGRFGENKNVIAKAVYLESVSSCVSFLKEVYDAGLVPDVVVLSAGRFAWDHEFANEESAIEELYRANVVTKECVLEALKEVFGSSLSLSTVVIISSHAAHFAVDHPFRKGEEGYVRSMQVVSALAHKLQSEGVFQRVVLEEPGRIGTESAKNSFTAQTIGEDPDWGKEISPEVYVQNVFVNAAL
jgi:NADP-dependent 3-hydroxy acid dehydrogenase YdfG